MGFLVDCVGAGIQCYLLAGMICNHFPIKEPKKRSFWLAFTQMWLVYFACGYIFQASPVGKIISGSLIYVLGGLFFYKGGWIKKIGWGIFQYILLMIFEFLIQLVMFRDLIELIKTLPLLEMNMLARVLGTPMVFLLCLGTDFLMSHHKGRMIKAITGLGVLMALIQWLVLKVLFTVNAEGMVRDCIGVSFIFSSVLMTGYIVVTELFRAKLRQQEKKNELEQICLETEYQYELYQQALKQGEELRDLRHDMRNQLQTMEYLLSTKKEEDKEYAVKMLHEMKIRTGI